MNEAPAACPRCGQANPAASRYCARCGAALHAGPLSVLLVDDNVFNREGVRLYLQQQGHAVAETGDEATAWQLANGQRFDAAVIDISIPATPEALSRPNLSFGLDLAQRLKTAQPALGIVLFSAHEDRGAEVLDMIRAGVRGLAYKLKGCPPAALLRAIDEAVSGHVVIDPEVHANRPGLGDELLKRLTPDEALWVERALAALGQLTPREKEIAHRLAASHNTEGIARALSVTPKTAENYIGHVYDKLGLTDMTREAPHLRKIVILAKTCIIHDLRAGEAG